MAAIKAKVTQVGNSLGVVLPKEMLERLHVTKGDQLMFVETDSGYSVSGYDPDVAEELALAREIMSAYRHTLRELAR